MQRQVPWHARLAFPPSVLRLLAIVIGALSVWAFGIVDLNLVYLIVGLGLSAAAWRLAGARGRPR